MAPTSDNPETPSSVEKGQPTEKQSEKPSEPPFTDKEKNELQVKEITAKLPPLREAATKDRAALEATEKTFNQEPPPVKFTEEAGTVKEVRELETELQESQQRPGNLEPERQPQPEIKTPQWQEPEKGKVAEQPVAEKRPPLFHEAPIKQEATREQTADQLKEKLTAALDKIYDKIESNNGQMPEDPTELAGLKDVFQGSRALSEATVAGKIEQLKKSFAEKKKGGSTPSRDDFKTMGLDAS